MGGIFGFIRSSTISTITTSDSNESHRSQIHHAEDDDEDVSWDLRENFHNTVRENIIFFIFFLTLCGFSWSVVCAFLRKKERESNQFFAVPADDDDSIVYRICFWICVFSLSISIGATLLLPLSVISNEVLLLYPNSYYVQWLNGMLVQGLWNLIFLFANISLFILLPFAYLFIESEGFSGHKKGVIAKFQEAAVVLGLVGLSVWGIAYILAAFLSPGRFSLGGLLTFNFFSQLPFIYSCISFLGVLLLLVCTPLGFAHLFTVLSQQMVGPQFFRNLDEEFEKASLELESLKNKFKIRIQFDAIADSSMNIGGGNRKRVPSGSNNSNTQYRTHKESSVDSSRRNSSPVKQKYSNDVEFMKKFNHMATLVRQESEEQLDMVTLKANIDEKQKEVLDLEKLKKTPAWKRNLVYPVAFLMALFLTAIAVFMVALNTLQLVVGIKAFQLSAESISLGLNSVSMLGAWGAALEVILIFYFISTSLIGLYNLPGVRKIRPKISDSPTSHIIYNCGLVLILSSALPLLARILGISNFDLLGHYGKIEWLQNFYLVLLYNIVFSASSTMCLVTKFTAGIRQELLKRFRLLVCDMSRLGKFWKGSVSNPTHKSEMEAVIKED